ncbi:MAG: hypothetical protein CL940_07185 [Deltaproteobacteria bacterium]|nr:hypothetical protein [Deltaproteobacteria bacterium]
MKYPTYLFLLALGFSCVVALSSCESAEPSEETAVASGKSDDPSDQGSVVSCDPGAESGCLCDNGYIGAKVCADTGEAYGECVCQTCTPDCTDMACGGDGCGGSCGTCFGADICKNGECKFNTQCPVEGTGRLVGDQVKNITFTGAHALPLELHSMCGEPKAIWLTLVAGWCTACTTLAPEFQNVHQQFIDEDVEWLLVVGEDGGYTAADWNYAKQYHGSKGYPDSWPYVVDPGFQGLIDAIQILDAEGALWLPAHIVIGSDMSIRFISNNQTTEVDAMVALNALL